MSTTTCTNGDSVGVVIGVLALQGAFEEHQRCLEQAGVGVVTTVQIRTPDQLSGIDAIVLPGGESTAMALIGEATEGMWDGLRSFVAKGDRPVWGTCAGMILLAERCVGTSAVIASGQSLVGGLDATVCRNYFGSQISSFEMNTPPPPRPPSVGGEKGEGEGEHDTRPFPGVFIRAPAILSAGPGVTVLGKVVAPPCRAAAAVLQELERKIAAGEDVVRVGVVDALERKAGGALGYADVILSADGNEGDEEKKEEQRQTDIELPGASDGTNAREVICAVQRGENMLVTAFHPEISDDLRWHQYFVGMVRRTKVKL